MTISIGQRCFAAVLGIGASACGSTELVESRALFSESDAAEWVLTGAVFDTLWVLGGPGELKNVRALDVRDDGAVVLVDSGNRRVVTLDAVGQRVSEVPLRRSSMISSTVALSGDRMAVHGSRPLWGIMDGGEVRPVEGPAALGDPLFVPHSGRIARWSDDKWVFGFGYGNGWMVFDGPDLIGAYPYVEHTDFPLVQVVNRLGGSITQTVGGPPVTSGRSVSVVGDTLLVQYLHSDLLPHFSNRAAAGDDGKVFTLYSTGVFPVIVALMRGAS